MKILVPVDFSSTSKKALLFAAEMARELKAEILVCHFYQFPLVTTEAPLMYPVDETLNKASEKRMAALIKTMTKKYDVVKFTGSVEMGYAPAGIAERQLRDKCELIIMGAKSDSKVAGYSFGSTSIATIRNTTCPVLTVQTNSEFKGINKILFAADYGDQYFRNAMQLIGLMKAFKPEICLVHVSDGKFDEEFELSELDAFKNQLIEKSGYKTITTRLIQEEDIFNGLMSFVNSSGADLFAISSRNHTIFEKLFKKGLTKKIILESSVPVLTLHDLIEN